MQKKNVYLMYIFIFVIVTLVCLGFSYSFSSVGQDFKIEGMMEKDGELHVLVTPLKNLKEYHVEILENNQVIYETKSNNSSIPLKNFEADYKDSLQINAYAIDEQNEKIINSNMFTFQYNDPTFQKVQNHYIAKNSDLNLKIVGFNPNSFYHLELYYNQTRIYHSKVTSEDLTIPYFIVQGYSGRIMAQLKNDSGRVLSTFAFYLNTPLVGKMSIINPDDGYLSRWNDINISFNGGENANHFYGSLYVNGKQKYRIELERVSNTVTIPAEILSEDTNYTFVLEAVYEDYFEIGEKAELTFTIGKKETTNPVYVSHNPSFVKFGENITLKSMTSSSTIYYTTDGSIPNENSMIYKEAIPITEDVVIKTYAVSKNRYDSVVNTYIFRVQDKTPVIYLSPSNQDENYGVSSTGFTSEMEMMNKITDVIENELKKVGFIVYRNQPWSNINLWTVESNYVGADFHFAIHSNASQTKLARGIEIFVNHETSPSFSIAANIYQNLWNIYEGNQNMSYYRGIKYARGTLGEVNDAYVNNGALIEIAFHDNFHDALWMANNITKIGQNLASSIISYYN